MALDGILSLQLVYSGLRRNVMCLYEPPFCNSVIKLVRFAFLLFC